MKERWIKICQKLSATDADFYAACRKIIRNVSVNFPAETWKNDLKLEDIGYTMNKLNRLKKDYVHKESHDKSVELWNHFLQSKGYRSTSFTTYNHIVKAGATSPSESIETRGPCLQSVVISLIPTGRGQRKAAVDVFYRTTELYKKFPADLLLIDFLLEPFDFDEVPLESIQMHFANVTCHPMYVIVPAAIAGDPVDFFEHIKDHDPKFFKECVSWTHKYLVTSRGITKFAQAIATQKKALTQLEKYDNLHLIDYIKEEYQLCQDSTKTSRKRSTNCAVT